MYYSLLHFQSFKCRSSHTPGFEPLPPRSSFYDRTDPPENNLCPTNKAFQLAWPHSGSAALLLHYTLSNPNTRARALRLRLGWIIIYARSSPFRSHQHRSWQLLCRCDGGAHFSLGLMDQNVLLFPGFCLMGRSRCRCRRRCPRKVGRLANSSFPTVAGREDYTTEHNRITNDFLATYQQVLLPAFPRQNITLIKCLVFIFAEASRWPDLLPGQNMAD